eukprot:2063828-Rhodomonas_salina.5
MLCEQPSVGTWRTWGPSGTVHAVDSCGAVFAIDAILSVRPILARWPHRTLHSCSADALSVSASFQLCSLGCASTAESLSGAVEAETQKRAGAQAVRSRRVQQPRPD